MPATDPTARWNFLRSLHVLAFAIGPTGVYAAATGEGRPRPSAGFQVAKGIYLSASVALTLRPDEGFRIQELGGSRIAEGRYALGAGSITFTSARGDVGRTRFPLVCRVSGIFGGFQVNSGQPACRAFEGLSFRRAN
ncbi:hypothetical protein ABIE45_006312 [Methylobacterium sp. OAE515]|uniref:hypothetical protein n=1 Tax=Methylobacterium sp. OAE515 TaxID=2817895 RepID=UPI00178A333C